MASLPSITIEYSPKLTLPTEQPVAEEAKGHWLKFLSRDGASPCYFQKIVAELTGTFVLVFVGCGSLMVNKTQSLTIVGIGLAWGLALMAMIYSVGHISGAHFNPAVTLAFAATRKLAWKQVPMYVLAQIMGATLASLTLRLLYHEQDNIQATVTQYKDTTSDVEATDHRACKDFAGVVIGATVVFNVIISGSITGTSMNPARSIGPAVVSGVYKNLWVYIFAPIIGAVAGAVVYSILTVPEPVAEIA